MYSVVMKIARLLCVCVITAGNVFVYSAVMKLELCVLLLVLLHDAGGFLFSSPAAQLAIEVGGRGGMRGFSRSECGVYSVNPHLTGG